MNFATKRISSQRWITTEPKFDVNVEGNRQWVSAGTVVFHKGERTREDAGAVERTLFFQKEVSIECNNRTQIPDNVGVKTQTCHASKRSMLQSSDLTEIIFQGVIQVLEDRERRVIFFSISRFRGRLLNDLDRRLASR